MFHFLKRILLGKRSTSQKEMYPDEVFLDSSNLSEFDVYQFEGFIEKPISRKTFIFMGSFFMVSILIFSFQLWTIQIKEGEAYIQKSENNHLKHSLIFSDRGMIYGRDGSRLAWNYIDLDNNTNDSVEFSKRNYDSYGMSHILGFVKYPAKDNKGFYYQKEFIGKEGVENTYNDILSGQNGLKIIETDVFGQIQSESVIKSPEPGDNIYLSIDSRIQKKFFDIIKDTAETFNFLGGVGIIMDIESGEIISMVNFPEYDSSVLTEGGDEDEIEKYINDDGKPFLNRSISGLYTPGSIIKPFVAVGALNENLIDPDKKIMSTGSISVPNPYFPDLYTVFTDWKAHGLVNMREALAVSSNVYFYNIGGGFEDQKGLGISNIEKYVKMFGFGAETGIDLEGERVGVIPNPVWKSQNFSDGLWRLGDTYNTSIGQYGFTVTPIQAVRATAALANGGYLVEPSIVLNNKGTRNRINIDERSLEIVKEGMRQAVLDGTARNANSSFVSIAAKTGTAEVGTQRRFVNSWLVGFFPYEEPKYAFTIMMERGPRDNLVGSVYVFRQLIDWMGENTPEYLNLSID